MTGSEASMRRSRGMSTPAMRATLALRALSLLHLVLGVVTDNQDHALAANDLASLAARLDGRSYLHDRSHPLHLAAVQSAASSSRHPPEAARAPRIGKNASARA